MRTRFSLFAALIYSVCLPQATEYVRNGNFESGTAPTCWAQADRADYWITQQQYLQDVTPGLYVHSPDYFDNNINFPLGDCSGSSGLGSGLPKVSAGAYSGNRYIGVGTYEIIQQEYIASLEEGKHYTVSMEVILSNHLSPSWNGSGRVKVGLAKNRVQYRSENSSEDICTADFVTYRDGPFQDIRIIGTFDLDAVDYPPTEGWKRISTSFRAWDNIQEYSWIFIDVEIPNFNPLPNFNNNCFGDYLYIDDVSLKRAEFCASPCSPSLGNITYWRYINNSPTFNVPPTGVIVGGSAGQSFYFFVENAIGIDFSVFNSWGEQIYNQYAFDPNGLRDNGFTDYWFNWNGEDINGDYLYSGNAVFAYNLTIWNCDPGSTISYIGNEVAYVPSNLANVQGPDIVNYELADCCDENAYFQNVIFNGSYRKDVHDFITAGANVINAPQGPVIVSSNANVLFRAGNSINLETGFNVQQGGIFNSIITDCIYGTPKNMNISRERPNHSVDSDFTFELINRVIVSPNPTMNQQIQINYVSNLINSEPTKLNYKVVSMNGRILMEGSLIENQPTDLNFAEKGVFLLRIENSQHSLLDLVKIVIL